MDSRRRARERRARSAWGYLQRCKDGEDRPAAPPISLTRDLVVFGRGMEPPPGAAQSLTGAPCPIQWVSTEDERVSRLHASITAHWEPSRWCPLVCIEDHSRNGTFLNGILLQPGRSIALSNGDRISLVLSVNPLAEVSYKYEEASPVPLTTVGGSNFWPRANRSLQEGPMGFRLPTSDGNGFGSTGNTVAALPYGTGLQQSSSVPQAAAAAASTSTSTGDRQSAAAALSASLHPAQVLVQVPSSPGRRRLSRATASNGGISSSAASSSGAVRRRTHRISRTKPLRSTNGSIGGGGGGGACGRGGNGSGYASPSEYDNQDDSDIMPTSTPHRSQTSASLSRMMVSPVSPPSATPALGGSVSGHHHGRVNSSPRTSTSASASPSPSNPPSEAASHPHSAAATSTANSNAAVHFAVTTMETETTAPDAAAAAAAGAAVTPGRGLPANATPSSTSSRFGHVSSAEDHHGVQQPGCRHGGPPPNSHHQGLARSPNMRPSPSPRTSPASPCSLPPPDDPGSVWPQSPRPVLSHAAAVGCSTSPGHNPSNATIVVTSGDSGGTISGISRPRRDPRLRTKSSSPPGAKMGVTGGGAADVVADVRTRPPYSQPIQQHQQLRGNSGYTSAANAGVRDDPSAAAVKLAAAFAADPQHARRRTTRKPAGGTESGGDGNYSDTSSQEDSQDFTFSTPLRAHDSPPPTPPPSFCDDTVTVMASPCAFEGVESVGSNVGDIFSSGGSSIKRVIHKPERGGSDCEIYSSQVDQRGSSGVAAAAVAAVSSTSAAPRRTYAVRSTDGCGGGGEVVAAVVAAANRGSSSFSWPAAVSRRGFSASGSSMSPDCSPESHMDTRIPQPDLVRRNRQPNRRHTLYGESMETPSSHSPLSESLRASEPGAVPDGSGSGAAAAAVETAGVTPLPYMAAYNSSHLTGGETRESEAATRGPFLGLRAPEPGSSGFGGSDSSFSCPYLPYTPITQLQQLDSFMGYTELDCLHPNTASNNGPVSLRSVSDSNRVTVGSCGVAQVQQQQSGHGSSRTTAGECSCKYPPCNLDGNANVICIGGDVGSSYSRVDSSSASCTAAAAAPAAAVTSVRRNSEVLMRNNEGSCDFLYGIVVGGCEELPHRDEKGLLAPPPPAASLVHNQESHIVRPHITSTSESTAIVVQRTVPHRHGLRGRSASPGSGCYGIERVVRDSASPSSMALDTAAQTQAQPLHQELLLLQQQQQQRHQGQGQQANLTGAVAASAPQLLTNSIREAPHDNLHPVHSAGFTQEGPSVSEAEKDVYVGVENTKSAVPHPQPAASLVTAASTAATAATAAAASSRVPRLVVPAGVGTGMGDGDDMVATPGTSRYPSYNCAGPGALICVLCGNYLKRALAVHPCGHTFCGSCLSRHLGAVMAAGRKIGCPEGCLIFTQITTNIPARRLEAAMFDHLAHKRNMIHRDTTPLTPVTRKPRGAADGGGTAMGATECTDNAGGLTAFDCGSNTTSPADTVTTAGCGAAGTPPRSRMGRQRHNQDSPNEPSSSQPSPAAVAFSQPGSYTTIINGSGGNSSSSGSDESPNGANGMHCRTSVDPTAAAASGNGYADMLCRGVSSEALCPLPDEALPMTAERLHLQQTEHLLRQLRALMDQQPEPKEAAAGEEAKCYLALLCPLTRLASMHPEAREMLSSLGVMKGCLLVLERQRRFQEDRPSSPTVQPELSLDKPHDQLKSGDATVLPSENNLSSENDSQPSGTGTGMRNPLLDSRSVGDGAAAAAATAVSVSASNNVGGIVQHYSPPSPPSACYGAAMSGVGYQCKEAGGTVAAMSTVMAPADDGVRQSLTVQRCACSLMAVLLTAMGPEDGYQQSNQWSLARLGGEEVLLRLLQQAAKYMTAEAPQLAGLGATHSREEELGGNLSATAGGGGGGGASLAEEAVYGGCRSVSEVLYCQRQRLRVVEEAEQLAVAALTVLRLMATGNTMMQAHITYGCAAGVMEVLRDMRGSENTLTAGLQLIAQLGRGYDQTHTVIRQRLVEEGALQLAVTALWGGSTGSDSGAGCTPAGRVGDGGGGRPLLAASLDAMTSLLSPMMLIMVRNTAAAELRRLRALPRLQCCLKDLESELQMDVTPSSSPKRDREGCPTRHHPPPELEEAILAVGRQLEERMMSVMGIKKGPHGHGGAGAGGKGNCDGAGGGGGGRHSWAAPWSVLVAAAGAGFALGASVTIAIFGVLF